MSQRPHKRLQQVPPVLHWPAGHASDKTAKLLDIASSRTFLEIIPMAPGRYMSAVATTDQIWHPVTVLGCHHTHEAAAALRIQPRALGPARRAR